jgi:hypothetical protein
VAPPTLRVNVSGVADERRQFDFWLGEWECEWDGARGSNTVTAELDGMALLERFDGRPGTELRGMSVSTYDADAAAWRQTWVDSSGAYLDFVGGWRDGAMDLRRDAVVDGHAFSYRMRFTDIAEGSLLWRWERTSAGAEAWQTLWRIGYTRVGTG